MNPKELYIGDIFFTLTHNPQGIAFITSPYSKNSVKCMYLLLFRAVRRTVGHNSRGQLRHNNVSAIPVPFEVRREDAFQFWLLQYMQIDLLKFSLGRASHQLAMLVKLSSHLMGPKKQLWDLIPSPLTSQKDNLCQCLFLDFI